MRMLRTGTAFLIVFICGVANANLKTEQWKAIPRGANVFSEISSFDLKFASTNKIRLLRMGAVGQHQDLRWLIKNDRFDLTKANMDRLKVIVSNATKSGVSVVLTLSELPGRRWRFKERDFRIWEDEKFQKEFINGWQQIAKSLKNESGIIGYDLMNEPYFREGQSSSKLNELYSKTIAAIREVDKDTPIVLQPAQMGSLDALEDLSQFEDANIIYSFHYYEPWVFFSKQKNGGKLKYPGQIPRWIQNEKQGPLDNWDASRHKMRLEKVKKWAEQRGLKPYQIFIGEFGVWKDAKGAERYLKDVLSIFSDMGWPWTYYAFREQGWQNADLEKGPLNPETKRPLLFEIIISHL